MELGLFPTGTDRHVPCSGRLQHLRRAGGMVLGRALSGWSLRGKTVIEISVWVFAGMDQALTYSSQNDETQDASFEDVSR